MKRGLRKWPDVPAAYGWLSLNRRGEWLLEGERVLHRGLIDVINQHYQPDRNGAWYFQNGPQKVFVDLEYTPLVYSLVAMPSGLSLRAHTGWEVKRLDGCWLDEEGTLLLGSDLGPGLVDGRDLVRLEPLLRGPRGEIPTSEECLAFIEGVMEGMAEDSLFLCYRNRLTVLGHLPMVRVEQELGFIAHPKPEE